MLLSKPVNLFRLSPSFREWCENFDLELDRLAIGDAVLEYLNNEYVRKEGWTYPAIAKELKEKKGFKSISRQSVSKVVNQLENLFKWLNGSKQERDELLSKIDSNGDSYRNILRRGIDCYRDDNILSWPQVVAIIRGEESGPSMFQKEIDGCSDFREIFQLTLSSARRMNELFSSKEGRLVRCLDEIHDLNALVRVNGQLKKENESLRQEVVSWKDKYEKLSTDLSTLAKRT